MKELRVRITLIEEMLGTLPANKDIYTEFIAGNAPTSELFEEEVNKFDDVDEESEEESGDSKVTVFPRNSDGKPFIYDYQIKGFFKEKCGFLRKCDGFLSKNLTAYKKAIDGRLFVFPRECVIDIPVDIGKCERPLRAETPKGARVALACSETIPAGSTFTFTVKCFDEKLVDYVREWLDYGLYHGSGQWRNSGKGRFYWEELDESGEVLSSNKP